MDKGVNIIGAVNTGSDGAPSTFLDTPVYPSLKEVCVHTGLCDLTHPVYHMLGVAELLLDRRCQLERDTRQTQGYTHPLGSTRGLSSNNAYIPRQSSCTSRTRRQCSSLRTSQPT